MHSCRGSTEAFRRLSRAAVSLEHLNQANDNCGWASKFDVFSAASIEEIVASLVAYVRDSTPEEIRAWKGSLPGLQRECR